MPIYKVTVPTVGVNTILQTSIRLKISRRCHSAISNHLSQTQDKTENEKNLTIAEVPAISVASPSETATK